MMTTHTCHRCRLHPALYGVWSPDIAMNEDVCCNCLTPAERDSVDAAWEKLRDVTEEARDEQA